MERKEILILIAACLAVVVVIAGIRTFREDDGSSPEIPVSSGIPAGSGASPGGTTNYWDYLHAQTDSTTTTSAAESGAATTDAQPEQTDTTETTAQSSAGGAQTTSTPFNGFVIQTENGSDAHEVTSSSSSTSTTAATKATSEYIIKIQ